MLMDPFFVMCCRLQIQNERLFEEKKKYFNIKYLVVYSIKYKVETDLQIISLLILSVFYTMPFGKWSSS